MDWIERLFHFAPDGGSGSLEVGIIAGAAVAFGMVIISAIKLSPVVQRWSSSWRLNRARASRVR
jgi:hypothetical protein